MTKIYVAILLQIIVSRVGVYLVKIGRMPREPLPRVQLGKRAQIYMDFSDWWVGVYYAPNARYYCFFCLVMKIGSR